MRTFGLEMARVLSRGCNILQSGRSLDESMDFQLMDSQQTCCLTSRKRHTVVRDRLCVVITIAYFAGA